MENLISTKQTYIQIVECLSPALKHWISWCMLIKGEGGFSTYYATPKLEIFFQ